MDSRLSLARRLDNGNLQLANDTRMRHAGRDPRKNPKVKTWNSQVSVVIYLNESDIVMAHCDRWRIPDKADINKPRHLILPLLLDKESGKVTMEYHERWRPLSKKPSLNDCAVFRQSH